MRYIHYGSSRFDERRWQNVHGSEQGFFNKPDGGLWASPSDADRGWSDWCNAERFGLQALKKSFEFELTPDARILEITPENVQELPRDSKLCERLGLDRPYWKERAVGIDFEKLAEEYDVLECNMSKYPQLYMLLYGWDCDCILVLNKEVIVVG